MSISVDSLLREIRDAMPSKSTLALVDELKESEQDFEWYPTTPRMLEVVARHYRGPVSNRQKETRVLDIGAGNGSALATFKKHLGAETKLLAIEKSEILTREMPADVLVIGSELEKQTLFDKEADLVFCNPPYSCFADWMIKIITESPCQNLFFVVPKRWEAREDIAAAIKERDASARVILEDNFHNAERKARAEVHVVKIEIPETQANAFASWVAREFSEISEAQHVAASQNERTLKKRHSIVESGGNFCDALVNAYNAEMASLQENYKAIGTLDPVLLKELEINVHSIAEIMAARIENLKKAYWQLLFTNLDRITKPLSAKNRRAMLDTLFAAAHVDFSLENIAQVIGWIARNTNQHITNQITETFDDMVSKACVVSYKSNQRVFGEEYEGRQGSWRFQQEYKEGKITHIKLDYRIVLKNHGGVRRGGEYWHTYRNGLDVRAIQLIQDLNTVADNLGFVPRTNPEDFAWTSGTKQEFLSDSGQLLFEARGFYNGNLHVRLAKDFALCWNVEYGRLKGWLLNASQASDEMDDAQAAKWFGASKALTSAGINQLMLT